MHKADQIAVLTVIITVIIITVKLGSEVLAGSCS